LSFPTNPLAQWTTGEELTREGFADDGGPEEPWRSDLDRSRPLTRCIFIVWKNSGLTARIAMSSRPHRGSSRLAEA
jgi:hypothetical protein